MRFILFLFLVFGMFVTCFAQDENEEIDFTEKEFQEEGNVVETESFEPYIDESSITIRNFDSKKLDSLKQNPIFQYDKQKPKTLNGWQRFKRWLWETIWGIGASKQEQDIRRILIYTFSTLTLLYVILRLLNADITKLFTPKSHHNNLQYGEMKDNFHFLNYEKLLKEALQTGQYNQAVRILYLQTLRKLSFHQLIHWERDKTNRDYVFELRNSILKEDFLQLTSLFEYVFYGEFEVTSQEFEEIRKQFDTFLKKIE